MAGNDGMPLERTLCTARFRLRHRVQQGRHCPFSNYGQQGGQFDGGLWPGEANNPSCTGVVGIEERDKHGSSIVAGAITEMRFRDSTLAPIQIRVVPKSRLVFRSGRNKTFAKLFDDSENV